MPAKRGRSKRKPTRASNDPLDELTPKQRRFVEYYDGNASEAARKAGYAHPRQEGARLLSNADIRRAIEARERRKTRQHIATREERQAFWTRVMLDQDEDLKHRLKASELLGKSQADFIERRQVEHAGGLLVRWASAGDEGLPPDPAQQQGGAD